MDGWKDRRLVAAACAVLALGFAGGWLAAKISEGLHVQTPGMRFELRQHLAMAAEPGRARRDSFVERVR